jgi:hypothetical protein
VAAHASAWTNRSYNIAVGMVSIEDGGRTDASHVVSLKDWVQEDAIEQSAHAYAEKDTADPRPFAVGSEIILSLALVRLGHER